MSKSLHWVECPRDAMQGMQRMIDTHVKIDYINHLIDVGFETIDIGSFVSPKAIPQMSDTHEVINGVEWKDKKPEFLVIVANERGAEDACKESRVDVIGFPFSISETFQQRNTGSSISESWLRLKNIEEMAVSAGKKMVVYLSMGFGNPYGDPYSEDIVLDWSQKISESLQVQSIALSDTIGAATPEQIDRIFKSLTQHLLHVQLGAHLHATKLDAHDKLMAAWNAGCRRIDTAMGGWGGCPMAKTELTGNMPSEVLRDFLISQTTHYNWDAFQVASNMTNNIFHQ
jgi:hydroxymethylglutaryl-CoA lyase